MSDRIESAVADQEDAGKAAAEEQAQAEQSTPAEASTEAPTVAADQPHAEADQEETPSATAESTPAAEPAADENAAEPTAAAEPEASSDAASDAVSGGDESAEEEEIETEEVVMPDGSKRMVRVLSVGQQVIGTVKRIADFGAFVDIGVGRDGLIHISELSVRRVGKVTDVLSEGQEVTAWIKKLDRDRNRISLTLIDPETKTIRDLQKDEIVKGTVTRILPYGAFVDIGIGRDALLHVREMAEGYVAKPEDVVKVGEELEARVIELSRRRGRVDLSLKGLRPEPEAAQPMAQSAPEPEEADDYDDQFEDVEVLSPMEMAFKRAMEAEGMELKSSKKKQGKRGRRGSHKSIQDEIIERTLSNR